MKVGITGGAGFIGGYVVEELIKRGHVPVIFDRRGRVPREYSPERGEVVDVFMGDVSDWTAMSELAARVDGIIHLAACLGTQETIDDPEPAFITNGIGGLNFIKACRKYDIPGANICVGNYWMQNSYSITKHTAERAVIMSNTEHGTRINQIRAVNAYGPRQSVAPPYGPAKVRKITPAMVCRAILGEQIEVYGDGTQISDMVHVSDVARALVSALEHAATGNVVMDPIGVGPRTSLSVNQIAHIISAAAADLGAPQQPPIKYLPMRPGEKPHDKVSVNPMYLAMIGVDPDSLIPFHTGIIETIRWFQRDWLADWWQRQHEQVHGDTVEISAAV